MYLNGRNFALFSNEILDIFIGIRRNCEYCSNSFVSMPESVDRGLLEVLPHSLNGGRLLGLPHLRGRGRRGPPQGGRPDHGKGSTANNHLYHGMNNLPEFSRCRNTDNIIPQCQIAIAHIFQSLPINMQVKMVSGMRDIRSLVENRYVEIVVDQKCF